MKRLLLDNLGFKVLALFLAFILWAYVGSRQVLERKLTLHLELGDMPAGMTLDSNVKTSIPVVLTGRKESILDVDPDDLKATVSLKSYVEGQKVLVVHPKVQPLPEGVTANLSDITLHLVPLAVPDDLIKNKKTRR